MKRPRTMKEHTIAVRGKSIHVRESAGVDTPDTQDARDASFPTLLCIHGNLGSGRWFEPLFAEYPGRAVAPDLPNFGESDHIDGFSMRVYAEWLVTICETLGVAASGRPLAVLGHSLGGAVAMELLYRRPALVSRLVLVDSSPVEGLVTPKQYHPAIEAYKADKAVLAAALRTMVPTLTDAEFFDKLVDDAWKMNRDCFIGHAEQLGNADYREKLAGVGTPVHVLRGDGDPLITERRAAETAAFFGSTVYTFAGCGHSPVIEQPERFNAVLLDILREDLDRTRADRKE